MTAAHQPDTEHQAFEAWAITNKVGYIDQHGHGFCVQPAYIKRDLWLGWHARATAAQVQIARVEVERDAAFAMTRCECSSEEACANLAKMRTLRDEALARVATMSDALLEVCRVLETNQTAIVDTVWVSTGMPETLLDHCRAALATPPATQEPPAGAEGVL